jgi:hypothetical protein
VTVIVVSFFESVVRDHSKDHAVTVVYIDDTLTGEPYTTLLDSTAPARGADSESTSRPHPERGSQQSDRRRLDASEGRIPA